MMYLYLKENCTHLYFKNKNRLRSILLSQKPKFALNVSKFWHLAFTQIITHFDVNGVLGQPTGLPAVN